MNPWMAPEALPLMRPELINARLTNVAAEDDGQNRLAPCRALDGRRMPTRPDGTERSVISRLLPAQSRKQAAGTSNLVKLFYQVAFQKPMVGQRMPRSPR